MRNELLHCLCRESYSMVGPHVPPFEGEFMSQIHLPSIWNLREKFL